MLPTSRKWRLFLAAFFGIGLTVIVLLVWRRSGREKTWPDEYDFGAVARGSTIEFGARFLMVDIPLSQRLLRHAPTAWRPTLTSWLPQPKKAVVVDTNAEPEFELPDFVGLMRALPSQSTRLNRGLLYFGAAFTANTDNTGTYSGVITIRAGRRHSSLPVRFHVVENLTGHRILVAASPFQAFATENGSDFAPLMRVLGSTGAVIDWRERLTERLDSYRTIILAEEALTSLDATSAARLRAFVATGGRLVLACNYFYRGTVAGANVVIEPFGLQVADQDLAGTYVITNLPSDRLNAGVKALKFHRPSPVQITDSSVAKLIAPQNASLGYIGAAQFPNGGEVIVIAQSLWWHWVKESEDAALFLRNALERP